MGFTLAIMGGLILIATFVADTIIVRRFDKRKDKTTYDNVPGNLKAALHNATVVGNRNDALFWSKLCGVFVLVVLQTFLVIDEYHKQLESNRKELKKVMSEATNIDARVTKIERFLWGDGGGGPHGPQVPGDPSGLGKQLSDLRQELEKHKADADALARTMNEGFAKMEVEIEKLQTAYARKQHRQPVGSHR